MVGECLGSSVSAKVPLTVVAESLCKSVSISLSISCVRLRGGRLRRAVLAEDGRKEGGSKGAVTEWIPTPVLTI